ncbi:15513_t:CDS:2 [Funneliformis caledonium]|uniref:15513_t:CDS:1 n=1 Tax=Funneliformis caledonium TaxID=1117310 RepID=A0A9N9FKI3_9GLOM|nr:15513_t:CDS:2 [Funneliformis caledonium]
MEQHFHNHMLIPTNPQEIWIHCVKTMFQFVTKKTYKWHGLIYGRIVWQELDYDPTKSQYIASESNINPNPILIAENSDNEDNDAEFCGNAIIKNKILLNEVNFYLYNEGVIAL